jgi:hypothetical protein
MKGVFTVLNLWYLVNLMNLFITYYSHLGLASHETVGKGK